jgi:hypothetical protein
MLVLPVDAPMIADGFRANEFFHSGKSSRWIKMC